MTRHADRARLSIAWAVHDLGYRLQSLAHHVRGHRTPGPTPLYFGALLELTHAADVSTADLIERAEAGGYFTAP